MNDKLDMKEIIRRIKDRDLAWFDNLSEKEFNSIPSIILIRWLSGTNDINQILKLNDIVNPVVFNLHKHKQLILKLMMCSIQTINCQWIAKKAKKINDNVKILSKHLNISIKEAEEYLPLFSNSDIINIVESHGLTMKDIKKYLK